MKPAAHHRRFPVRNPRAGILADWFGIDGGAAKALLVLYEDDGPLYAADIAPLAPCTVGSVKVLCRDLRRAGLNVPSKSGRNHQGYVLSEADRTACRAAFAHTLTILGRAVPDLDDLEERLAELRAYQAHDDAHRDLIRLNEAFGVQACVARVLIRLAKARGEYVSTEMLVAALRRDILADEPSGKYTSMLICLARRALGHKTAPVIDTAYGFGYRLTARGLAMVEGAVSGVDRGADRVAGTLEEAGFA